jgi:NADH dehydrogenase
MILIVGATGALGGGIAQMLLAQGRQVRVLARHNSPAEEMAKMGMATSLKTLTDARAEVVYGDLKDPASLEAACQGVDTLITTANSVLRSGEDTIESVDHLGNLNLIEAARKAGVKHFIFTSALGSAPDHPAPLFAAKGKVEQALRQSGLAYTILAPDLFMDVWAMVVVGAPVLQGQPVPLIEPASHRHSLIAGQDVAAYAVAAVDNPAAKNAYLPLGGPEGLSWKEVVAAFERVLGRPVEINLYKPGETLPGQPDWVNQMLPAMESYESILDMSELSKVYGVTPTSMEAFVRQKLAG